ncbi:oxysterol-binding protein 2-like [Echinops telfairi]|uniref:Oxysterol-binding protein 2-like n=1 Tax=Echinops telfairi TaxID=9371 RepID=A0AC55D163_ECHTE|nr:oxysterol-binding protein 2-like [Echinops telfairi]
MSASAPGARPEPKPQPQPQAVSEPEPVSEQVLEPVYELVLRSEFASEPVAEPEPGQEPALLLGLGSGSGSRPPGAGAGPFTKTALEQLENLPLTNPPLGPLQAPRSGSVPRPGQNRASPSGPAFSGAAMTSPARAVLLPLDSFKGWLLKWTNYLKGYQRRWFVLSNGLLSYYRNQDEMAHTCRGTINLSTTHIDTEDSCNILLTSGARTYHLKASSEVERQQWITALELAKAKAVRMMNNHSGTEPAGRRAEVWELTG